MRRNYAVVFLLALLLSCTAFPAGDEPLAGYSAAASHGERDWEGKLRAIPQAANLREYMHRMSARPHHVGSPYDKDNAEWILGQFKSFGLDARIESFDVLFPTPKTRILEMIEPSRYAAALEEPALAVDPTSGQKSEQLPTYNAYSGDGDVTAPLVFVNYGLPGDYEELERLGVSARGAIVIAKYGESWRGIKPKVAAEHGAVGCLIYSDPRDDGYFVEAVFPEGPMRNSYGVQRGSVMDFASSNPGDPLTPGVGATTDAKRLPLNEAPSITKIPVLPISYGDARPLLAAMKGPMAPARWRGALDITYHVGPGPAKVRLKVESNWDIKRLYNVVAEIPGSVAPSEWIVRGNHHDAWVNGADDPVSAQAALLEEARALGELLKQGWKPRRTIIYCAWDGEEPMLLGSTEWAEMHANELARHAAVYVNTDANSRGLIEMEGSHSLEAFINDVARDIQDPETGLSVWKRRQLSDIVRASSANDRSILRTRRDLRIRPLGSGSDYTAFLDHLGIASLNLSYGGEDPAGIYHSIYDDFYWYTHFSDIDFVYGRALAQTIGVTVMRLADAEVLPFDFTNLADTVKMYNRELQELLRDRQEESRERNQELDEGAFRAVSDPRRPAVDPVREEVPPFINFAPLQNSVDTLAQSAERYQQSIAKAQEKLSEPGSAALIQAVNEKLIQLERRLTSPEGLPRRPWYKHLLYAPGVYTGYSPKTVPGVREGIELKRYSEAEKEIVRVAQALADAAAAIDAVSQLLGKIGN